MNNHMVFYCGAILIGVFISCVSQVILKKSSKIHYNSWIREYLNVRVISAYSIFFLATLLSVFAYRVVPLSTGAMLETTSYIYITIFDKLIFKEKISRRKLLSMVLIVIGVIVFAVFG